MKTVPERKAKEAEAAMREIARAAREAHRRNADLDSAPAPPASQGKTRRVHTTSI